MTSSDSRFQTTRFGAGEHACRAEKFNADMLMYFPEKIVEKAVNKMQSSRSAGYFLPLPG